MPRVRKLGVRADPRAVSVLSEIGGGKTALHITQSELAKRAGMEPSLLSRRMKNIGEMRLSELWAIQDVIKRGLK